MSRDKKITVIALIIAGGLAAALLYHQGCRLAGLPYPYNTPLFRPADRFMDYINNYNSWRNWNAPNVIIMSQLSTISFGHFFSYIFSLISPLWLSLSLYLGIFSILMAAIAWENVRIESKWETALASIAFAFLTYPFIFAFDRANREIYIFCSLYMFLRYYRADKPALAGLFFAAAWATKPFCSVFAVLMLSEKKYRALFYAAVFSFALNLISIAALAFATGRGAGALKKFMPLTKMAAGSYMDIYVYGNEGLPFSHSLFTPIKLFLRHFYGTFYDFIELNALVHTAVSWYFAFALLLFAVVAFYVFCVEKTFWKKVALLVCSMNLLPYVSADYRLLHLLLPCFLFINKEEQEKTDYRYCWLFGLLLIPKNYYIRSLFVLSRPETNNLGLLLNPGLMVALCVFIMRERLTEAKAAAISLWHNPFPAVGLRKTG